MRYLDGISFSGYALVGALLKGVMNTGSLTITVYTCVAGMLSNFCQLGLGSWPSKPTDGSPAIGGGGEIKILAGKVSSLAVRDAAFRDHAIGASEFLNMLSTVVATRLEGIIGYDFLSQFRVHNRLSSEPA
jgi:hypothetical protein